MNPLTQPERFSVEEILEDTKKVRDEKMRTTREINKSGFKSTETEKPKAETATVGIKFKTSPETTTAASAAKSIAAIMPEVESFDEVGSIIYTDALHTELVEAKLAQTQIDEKLQYRMDYDKGILLERGFLASRMADKLDSKQADPKAVIKEHSHALDKLIKSSRPSIVKNEWKLRKKSDLTNSAVEMLKKTDLNNPKVIYYLAMHYFGGDSNDARVLVVLLGESKPSKQDKQRLVGIISKMGVQSCIRFSKRVEKTKAEIEK